MSLNQLDRYNSEKHLIYTFRPLTQLAKPEQTQVEGIERQGKNVSGSGSRKDWGVGYVNFKIYEENIHIHQQMQCC